MRPPLERFVLALLIAPLAPWPCSWPTAGCPRPGSPWGALTGLVLGMLAVNWVLTFLSVRLAYRRVSTPPS